MLNVCNRFGSDYIKVSEEQYMARIQYHEGIRRYATGLHRGHVWKLNISTKTQHLIPRSSIELWRNVRQSFSQSGGKQDITYAHKPGTSLPTEGFTRKTSKNGTKKHGSKSHTSKPKRQELLWDLRRGPGNWHQYVVQSLRSLWPVDVDQHSVPNNNVHGESMTVLYAVSWQSVPIVCLESAEGWSHLEGFS